MKILFGNNDRKQELIEEYMKIGNEAELAYRESLRLANQWGIANTILGLSIAITSSFSAILTFSDNQIATRALAFISALCAVSMTSLSPANRETKRRSMAALFLIQSRRIQTEIAIYKDLSRSETEMIETLRKLKDDFSVVIQETAAILGGTSN